MKKLNREVVNTVLDNLILTNDSTSNLEVKNALRALGFYAEQKAVKEFVSDILKYGNGKYQTEDNGTYFTISFKNSIEIDTEGQEKTKIDSIVQLAESVFEMSDQSPIAQAVLNCIKKVAEEKKSGNTDKHSHLFNDLMSAGGNEAIEKYLKQEEEEEELELNEDVLNIYYSKSEADSDDLKDDKDWVAFSKKDNEIHIYDQDLGRDKVRALYAKATDTKFQDVRAKRVSRF